ncbi:hypothetical protein R4J03_05845 [Brachyspira intermedia]|uniref:dual OB domain-containing protein n=1 Tax=Brachyspira intermedia TaxID=84377 RepID=UPI003005080B
MEIIVLTKSFKNGKYCVAGLDINNNSMIRLGIDETFEISNYELKDKNKIFINIGDIIKITKYKNMPIKNQPENIIIDFNDVEIISNNSDKIINILNSNLTNADYVFVNNNSYLQEYELNNEYSLSIIEVSDMTIYISDYNNKTKANFHHKNNKYTNFSVTDPNYFNIKDEIMIKRAYCIASLSNVPYNGNYYKFIAKIFEY